MVMSDLAPESATPDAEPMPPDAPTPAAPTPKVGEVLTRVDEHDNEAYGLVVAVEPTDDGDIVTVYPLPASGLMRVFASDL